MIEDNTDYSNYTEEDWEKYRKERRRYLSKLRYDKQHPRYIPDKHDDEEYRDVIGYPDYEVSNYGNVRKKSNDRFLKGSISDHGYHMVTMTDENHHTRLRPIHRIEAEAFLDNGGIQGLQVNHKDGVKTNNKLSNLEWCTPSENIQHAHDHGLIKYTEETTRKHREVSRKLYPPIRCLETGKVYPDARAAARDLADYDCIPKCIRDVANGKNHSHRELHFENADWSEINVFD